MTNELELIEALQKLDLGPRLLTEPAELSAFGSDGLTTFHELPLAVVIAETADDVIACVRACYCAGVPFVARPILACQDLHRMPTSASDI